MDRIYYFDNNGTTQLSQNVSRMMAKVNFYIYGNPSSIYTVGVEAKEIVEDARRKIAKLFDEKMRLFIVHYIKMKAENKSLSHP